jgi:hypothetical protein
MNPPPPKKVAPPPTTLLPSRRSLGAGLSASSINLGSPATPSLQSSNLPRQTFSGATLGKTYAKRPTNNPLVQRVPVQVQPPVPPRQQLISAPSAFQSFMSQPREPFEPASLLEKISLTGPDSFELQIPILKKDVEFGYTGAFAKVPHSVAHISCRLQVDPNPIDGPQHNTTTYTVSGHHGNTVHTRNPDGSFSAQLRSVPFVAKSLQDSNGRPEAFDFSVQLSDSINSIDICLTATNYSETGESLVSGVHQTYCLIIDRS